MNFILNIVKIVVVTVFMLVQSPFLTLVVYSAIVPLTAGVLLILLGIFLSGVGFAVRLTRLERDETFHFAWQLFATLAPVLCLGYGVPLLLRARRLLRSPFYQDQARVEQEDERALLIDCGMGYYDLVGTIARLTDKPYVVVITHGHPDHAGMMHLFDQVYMNEKDLPLLPWAARTEFDLNEFHWNNRLDKVQ